MKVNYTKRILNRNRSFQNKKVSRELKKIAKQEIIKNYVRGYNSLDDINNKEFNIKNINPEKREKLAKKLMDLLMNEPVKSKWKIQLNIHNNNTDETYEQWYTLNEVNIEFFKKIFSKGDYNFEIPLNYKVSDPQYITEENEIETIKFVNMEKLEQTYKSREGRFFDYNLINDTFDLSKFQIYSKPNFEAEHCFIHALRESQNVDNNIIESIKKDIGDIRYLRLKSIRYYANKHKLNIHVQYWNNTPHANKLYKYEFGNEKPIIKLIIMYNHIMINEPMKINYNYYKYLNDDEFKKLPIEKQLLVKTKDRYKGFIFHNEIPIKKPVQMIPLLFKNNAFKPIKYNEIPHFLEKHDCETLTNNTLNPYLDMFKYSGKNEVFASISDLYTVSGNTQNFIEKTIRGARVYCQEKQYINENIVDLDVRSLYPYIMSKIKFPTGILYKTKELNKYGFYKINIEEINKNTKIPIIKDLTLGINYLTGIDIYDLIKYQQIKYKIIEGYIFKSYSSFIQNYMKILFNKRREAIKQNNTNLANEYKFRMNSFFGKCMKKNNCEKKYFVKNENVNKFFIKNYNSIKHCKKTNEGYEFTLYKYYSWSNNFVYYSSLVLSFARHYMNKFLIPNEDIILYHDTDSIMLKMSDFNKIKQNFNIGNNLGDFHSDLPNNFNYATEAIFISKKRYLLKLPDNTFKFVFIGYSNDKIKKPYEFFKSLLNKK